METTGEEGKRRLRQPGPPRLGFRLRKRWWLLLLPLLGSGALVAIAPPLPPPTPISGSPAERASTDQVPTNQATTDQGAPFRYQPDASAFLLDFDPRKVEFGLYEGWDREAQAYADTAALAFVSGPMYERHRESGGIERTVPLGDLKLGSRVWRGRNRSAAQQRAYLGIGRDGRVDFGYGELTPEREARYDTFIGGLHSIYNDLEAPPSSYRGAYSIGMGQQIRYYLPRIRVLYGLRPDGRLEVLMSRDGLTLEETRALARQRGLRAAYLPDHASKSRMIIPGVKDFSQEDANWISGGATSFVHVPYMLRLSRRETPLQGSLLAGLAQRLPDAGCGTPLHCVHQLGNTLVDRALAGLNRLMEQGVEPVARLLWAPRVPHHPQRPAQKAPLREPVINADPQPLRQRQAQDLEARFTPEPAAAPPPRAPGPEPRPQQADPAGPVEDSNGTPAGGTQGAQDPAAPPDPAATNGRPEGDPSQTVPAPPALPATPEAPASGAAGAIPSAVSIPAPPPRETPANAAAAVPAARPSGSAVTPPAPPPPSPPPLPPLP